MRDFLIDPFCCIVIRKSSSKIRCWCRTITLIPRTSLTICYQVHKRSLHKKILFPCPSCEYVAKVNSHLKQHVRSVHDKIRYHRLLFRMNKKIYLSCQIINIFFWFFELFLPLLFSSMWIFSFRIYERARSSSIVWTIVNWRSSWTSHIELIYCLLHLLCAGLGGREVV